MCASSSWPPTKDASALLDMYELDTALNSTSSTTPTTPISDASALLDMYELVASYSATTGTIPHTAMHSVRLLKSLKP